MHQNTYPDPEYCSLARWSPERETEVDSLRGVLNCRKQSPLAKARNLELLWVHQYIFQVLSRTLPSGIYLDPALRVFALI